MFDYLAIAPNIPSHKNKIFQAENFSDAKKKLKGFLKEDTRFQEIKLIELNTLKTKLYFIEKM